MPPLYCGHTCISYGVVILEKNTAPRPNRIYGHDEGLIKATVNLTPTNYLEKHKIETLSTLVQSGKELENFLDRTHFHIQICQLSDVVLNYQHVYNCL